MRVLAIGEILWDILPNGPRLGGAPLNFSVQLHQLGHQVAPLSALGDDALGRQALERIRQSGLDDRLIQTSARHATGTVEVTLGADGPDYVIHRPAAYDDFVFDAATLETLAAFRPDWIYLGTLFANRAEGRRTVEQVLEACPGVPCLYDVNLRRDSYTPELVEWLLSRAAVVKLNEGEREQIAGWFSLNPLQAHWRALAVTRGEHGCVLWTPARTAEHPGFPAQVVDSVGAGDAFAAGLLHGLDLGWPLAQVAEFANRMGAGAVAHAGAVPGGRASE